MIRSAPTVKICPACRRRIEPNHLVVVVRGDEVHTRCHGEIQRTIAEERARQGVTRKQIREEARKARRAQ